jgi:multidrug efflux pump subunit AcrB
MYMTPAMCFWFLRLKSSKKISAPAPDAAATDAKKEESDPYGGRFYRIYRRLLQTLLRHRFVVLMAAVGVLCGGGFIGSQLVREFFGPSDRNQFLVYLDLPAGTRIEHTDQAVQRLNQWLSNKEENPEITSTIAYVGTGGPRFFLTLSPLDPDPHLAFMVVNTRTGDSVPALIRRIRQHMDNFFPNVNARLKQMWMGSEEPGFVEIRLYGLDPDYLFAKGSQLTNLLRATPGTLDVRNNWENKIIKAAIVVDQARARRAGLTSKEVALSLQSHMDGIKVTEYREGDVAIPVLVRSREEERETLGDLWNVTIRSPATGQQVPITQIADLRGHWDFSRIARRNQERCLTVEVKHEILKAPELMESTKPLIDQLELRDGVRWEVGGELETAAETNEKLFRWMPLCFFGIIVLLVWQFNSFRRPLIILTTLPLAFTGAFIGLLIMRAPFDFFGLLGLLSLAGVIINNGIVLIDRIDSERARGLSAYDAVLSAAISRLRPINMTTITTVLGVMPLILSFDPLFYAMASILASGLIFGTLLTLGVVPVLYAVLFRIGISS